MGWLGTHARDARGALGLGLLAAKMGGRGLPPALGDWPIRAGGLGRREEAQLPAPKAPGSPWVPGMGWGTGASLGPRCWPGRPSARAADILEASAAFAPLFVPLCLPRPLFCFPFVFSMALFQDPIEFLLTLYFLFFLCMFPPARPSTPMGWRPCLLSFPSCASCPFCSFPTLPGWLPSSPLLPPHFLLPPARPRFLSPPLIL